MIREELEFRIACYADGTLPPGGRAAVEAEVAADPEARTLLAEYQALQRSLADSGPLPAIRWDRLANHLSAAVADQVITPGVDGHATPEAGRPLQAASDEGTEFAIACYADGTLAAEKRPGIERLLAADASARALLDEYQNLDAIVRATAYEAALPPVDWDRLAAGLSDAVAVGAGVALPEEFERQVAGYADGTLPAADRDAVEARLASEPAARVALSRYRNLDAALTALPASAPLPSIDWDQLAGRISAAVKKEAATDAPASAGPYPIRAWLRSPIRMAAAASILVAAILGARLVHRGGVKPKPGDEVATTLPTPAAPAPPASYADVSGPKPEAPAGPSVEEIRIGPPKEFAEAGGDDGEGVVSRPPRAFVAAGSPPPPRPPKKDADVLPAIAF